MGIHRLIHIAKRRNLNTFSIEELVCSMAPYEMALIDVSDVKVISEFLGDTPPCVEVSEDVRFLQKLLLNDSYKVMLPCPVCRQKQPFVFKRWYNPQNVTLVEHNSFNSRSVGHMIFRNPSQQLSEGNNGLVEPYFNLNSAFLCDLSDGDKHLLSKNGEWNLLLRKCVDACKRGLMNNLNEIRIEYACTFDTKHSLYMDFRMFDPIVIDDTKEYDSIVNSKQTKGQKDIIDAYKKLQNCLILQKTGQYPSLADMSISDMSKYEKVLESDIYSDFRKAIVLNADGIGCGSFVYLRRVFERVIEEVAIECHVNMEKLEGKRTNEKVKIIENEGGVIIPDSLSEVKELIYGVLSKGVHSCSDQDCLEVFPFIKYCIVKMIDERLRHKEEDKEYKAVKKALNDFKAKHEK